MRIQLQSPQYWRTSDDCCSRGCACLGDELVRDGDLLASVSGFASVEQAIEFAGAAGGFFAFIRKFTNGDAVAAVDRGRSMPLFFAEVGGELVLSDSARLLAQQLPATEPQAPARAEFELLGCVAGNDTLHPQVRQLRAGELLVYSAQDGSHRIVRYFRYRQEVDPAATRESLLRQGEQAVARAVANLVAFANGRQIAVPLSGGMDSTMLLAALVQSGYQPLLAFTYGREQCSEVRYSSTVAEELGVRWRHVPYSGALWRRWFSSRERGEYYAMADNLCTLPHIQDFPAIAELKQAGALQPGTVICSGMSVESFYGSPSQPPDPLQSSMGRPDPDGLAAMIIDSKYRLWPTGSLDPAELASLRDRILAAIGDLDYQGNAASAYESWFTHEKMSKFYNNSVRVYEYWGYDWWLPFWDKPVIEFWQQVPPAWRRLRLFTLELVERIYRKACGRTYRPDMFETAVVRGARYFRHLRQVLPPLGGIYDRMKRNLKYDTDPMDWFGLFDRGDYNRLYHPRLSINSLLVKEYFGELQALPADEPELS